MKTAGINNERDINTTLTEKYNHKINCESGVFINATTLYHPDYLPFQQQFTTKIFAYLTDFHYLCLRWKRVFIII